MTNAAARAPLPLSFQQLWLWEFLQKHADWRCVASHVFRLRGSLDVSILERALEAIVRRHSSLRARIVLVDGLARQCIDEPAGCHLEVIPVAGDTAAAIETNARQLLEEFWDRKMNPLAEPLLRMKVFQLASDEHWFALATHRLLADCSSIDHALEDVWTLYTRFHRGELESFDKEPGQYADYALWQHRTSAEWAKRHSAYWSSRLEGATCVQWPVDEGPAPEKQGFVAHMTAHLGARLSQQLRDLARTTHTLAATVVLSSFVTVVWRWCGQRSFVVPLKIAGRLTEQKATVGYFPHLLYLRVALTGEETFTELLNLVTGEFFRALSHQDFGRMSTQIPSLLAGAFFQWVTWQGDATRGHPALLTPHLTAERLGIREFGEGLTAIPPGMVDVELTCFDTPEGIYASGVYRADRFRSNTMERFMADLCATAEQFVRNPHARVATSRSGA